jgi:hypothetical protein
LLLLYYILLYIPFNSLHALEILSRLEGGDGIRISKIIGKGQGDGVCSGENRLDTCEGAGFGVNCKFECDNVAVYEWYRINGIRGQSGEARGDAAYICLQKFTRNIGGLDCTSVAYMTSPLCVGIDSHISARHVALAFGVDLEENASGDVAKIVKVGNEFGLVGEQICSKEC